MLRLSYLCFPLQSVTVYGRALPWCCWRFGSHRHCESHYNWMVASQHKPICMLYFPLKTLLTNWIMDFMLELVSHTYCLLIFFHFFKFIREILLSLMNYCWVNLLLLIEKILNFLSLSFFFQLSLLLNLVCNLRGSEFWPTEWRWQYIPDSLFLLTSYVWHAL